jgi:hypothetical protein
MPARIGILDTLKIPLAAIAQLGPTKFAKKSNMGHLTPAELYEKRKESIEKRNTTCKSYNEFRDYLNKFDPNKAEPWDLYLKPGTAFDNTIKAALDRREGWTVTFVSEKDVLHRRELKRIEAKGGKGHMSITLWSSKGSAAAALAG